MTPSRNKNKGVRTQVCGDVLASRTQFDIQLGRFKDGGT